MGTESRKKKRKKERRKEDYLSFVADEVDLGLAGLRRRLRRKYDVGRLFRFLDEHVDQRLLLIRLRQWWQLRCGRRRRRRRLDEDYLVVLLRRLRQRHVLGRFVLGRFRWRHVDVHVLVDHRILLRRSITVRGWPVATGGTTPAGGWEVRAHRRLRRRFGDHQRDRRTGDHENRALK